jgi:hypothetical protein
MKRLKPAKARKTKGITIWFTPTDYEEIQRRCTSERKGPSTWVRDQLLSLMAMP